MGDDTEYAPGMEGRTRMPSGPSPADRTSSVRSPPRLGSRASSQVAMPAVLSASGRNALSRPPHRACCGHEPLRPELAASCAYGVRLGRARAVSVTVIAPR